MGSPREVGAACVYLASEEAAYVTGMCCGSTAACTRELVVTARARHFASASVRNVNHYCDRTWEQPMTTDIPSEVKRIIKEQLDVDEKDIKPESSLSTTSAPTPSDLSSSCSHSRRRSKSTYRTKTRRRFARFTMPSNTSRSMRRSRHRAEPMGHPPPRICPWSVSLLPHRTGHAEWRRDNANMASVAPGGTAVSPILRFSIAHRSASRLAGEVKGWSPTRWIERKRLKEMDRFTEFALGAAALAVDDAGLELSESERPPSRVFRGRGNRRSFHA